MSASLPVADATLRRETPARKPPGARPATPTGATGSASEQAADIASTTPYGASTMSTTQTSTETTTQTVAAVAEKFEVTALPVADVDRAKAFYLGLGWRLDIDYEPLPGVRGVQFTPPGSPASIQFGSGSTTMTEPHEGLILVVDDLAA